MSIIKICNYLYAHANRLEFECVINNDTIKISHPSTAFQLHATVKSEKEINLYITVRLSSWQVYDERTDLHEILSILYSSFMRSNPPYLNCAFVDMDHPILELPTEIYLRHIVFTQPLNGEKGYVTFSVQQVKDLVDLLYEFNCLTSLFVGFDHESNRTFKLPCLEVEWNRNLEKFFCCSGSQYQTSLRVNPDWLHYRNIDSGISLIKSVYVANALKKIISTVGKVKSIRYEKFDLVFNKKNENLRPRKIVVDGYKALNFFSGKKCRTYSLILDNAIVMVKDSFTYIRYISTGSDVVEYFKKDIVKRRKLENKLLFREESYAWKKTICPEQFENFCISLLNVLPQTLSVRKASPLNEPDEGMDLIWVVRSIAKRSNDQSESPITSQRIVVQCKVSNRSLGKGQVIDITDTMDYHNATGYYLITSAPSVTRTLRNTLLRKKDKGFNVDWWTKLELEGFIDDYPQLLSGNESMVTMT